MTDDKLRELLKQQERLMSRKEGERKCAAAKIAVIDFSLDRVTAAIQRELERRKQEPKP